jgi:hypothetical protein
MVAWKQQLTSVACGLSPRADTISERWTVAMAFRGTWTLEAEALRSEI